MRLTGIGQSSVNHGLHERGSELATLGRKGFEALLLPLLVVGGEPAGIGLVELGATQVDDGTSHTVAAGELPLLNEGPVNSPS
jgi:hypothetical protein